MNSSNLTDGPVEIEGLKLRPFTLGTFDLCRQLGLTMFSEGTVPADAADRLRQVAAYLFIQSEPLEAVLRAVDDPLFELAHLRPFKFRLTPEVIPAAMALIEKNLTAAGRAVVDIEPRPGGKADDPPPN
jgi:hypothetical protein